MTLLNGWLRPIFDALLFPLRALPPLAGLAVVSLLTSVVALLLFKATSDQVKLAAVKRRITACLFEIRLLRDDARGILRAQGEMLRHQGAYLKFAMVPMLLMLLMLFPVVAHLQFHHGYGGLIPGQETLVKVQLKDASGRSERPEARLEAPEGLLVTTPAVWIPSLQELSWRVRAEHRGDYEIRVHVGRETLAKSVRVSPVPGRRSPVRLAPGLANQLLYPAEDPLPRNSAVASIAVGYPAGSVSVFGWQLNWLVVFVALSTVFTLGLRTPLRVVL